MQTIEFKKPIYPDYDLEQDDYRLGMRSYVRKQDDKGVWYLICVILTWDKSTDFKQEELLQVIKLFHERCYKVIMFHIMPDIKKDKLKDANSRPIYYIDDDQRSEKERLQTK